MDPRLRLLVRRRAANRCEYCQLRQEDLPVSVFHTEHIVAKKHGGDDDPSNLALACGQCNLHKGPNLTGIDPHTSEVVELFHPRRQVWEDHFIMRDGVVTGLTPVGRATVRVCSMNSYDRIQLRVETGNRT